MLNGTSPCTDKRQIATVSRHGLIAVVLSTSSPPSIVSLSLALLLLLLSLEVLPGEVGRGTADQHEGVDADAQAGGIARVCGSDGAGLGCIGLWVAGL